MKARYRLTVFTTFPAAAQALPWSHPPLSSGCKWADLLEAWNFRSHPPPGPTSHWDPPPFLELTFPQTDHDPRRFQTWLSEQLPHPSCYSMDSSGFLGLCPRLLSENDITYMAHT